MLSPKCPMFALNASRSPNISSPHARNVPCEADLDVVLVDGESQVEQFQLSVVSVQQIPTSRAILARASHVLAQPVQGRAFLGIALWVVAICGAYVALQRGYPVDLAGLLQRHGNHGRLGRHGGRLGTGGGGNWAYVQTIACLDVVCAGRSQGQQRAGDSAGAMCYVLCANPRADKAANLSIHSGRRLRARLEHEAVWRSRCLPSRRQHGWICTSGMTLQRCVVVAPHQSVSNSGSRMRRRWIQALVNVLRRSEEDSGGVWVEIQPKTSCSTPKSGGATALHCRCKAHLMHYPPRKHQSRHSRLCRYCSVTLAPITLSRIVQSQLPAPNTAAWPALSAQYIGVGLARRRRIDNTTSSRHELVSSTRRMSGEDEQIIEEDAEVDSSTCTVVDCEWKRRTQGSITVVPI